MVLSLSILKNETVRNIKAFEGVEPGIMLALILASYLVGMIIQIREYKVKYDFLDWVLALISSLVFSSIVYFIVFKWINIGIRIGATVAASLRAYAVMKWVFSTEGEKNFINMFKKKVGFKNDSNDTNN